MKQNKLTDEEIEIENMVHSLQPVSQSKRKKIKTIIKHAGKNKSISLRIPNHDLNKIKERADSEGIPYQTLIGSVLHKYITDQLYDKKEVLKSLQLIKNKH